MASCIYYGKVKYKCWKLLRSLYSHVTNKVLCGDFECEFFYQNCGLKQGVCPISNSVFFSDKRFSRYAKNRNMGIELASQVINCLLFADDIVLLGKSETDLQAL